MSTQDDVQRRILSDWVSRLRSRSVSKTTMYLRSGLNTFSAMGLLMDVYMHNTGCGTWKRDGSRFAFVMTTGDRDVVSCMHSAPVSVIKELGLSYGFIATINRKDSAFDPTFDTVADYVEARFCLDRS